MKVGQLQAVTQVALPGIADLEEDKQQTYDPYSKSENIFSKDRQLLFTTTQYGSRDSVSKKYNKIVITISNPGLFNNPGDDLKLFVSKLAGCLLKARVVQIDCGIKGQTSLTISKKILHPDFQLEIYGQDGILFQPRTIYRKVYSKFFHRFIRRGQEHLFVILTPLSKTKKENEDNIDNVSWCRYVINKFRSRGPEVLVRDTIKDLKAQHVLSKIRITRNEDVDEIIPDRYWCGLWRDHNKDEICLNDTVIEDIARSLKRDKTAAVKIGKVDHYLEGQLRIRNCLFHNEMNVSDTVIRKLSGELNVSSSSASRFYMSKTVEDGNFYILFIPI